MANPTASILVFLFLTLGYSTLKYFTKDETSMNIWTWMYIALLMIAQFVINMNLTKEICGFNQFGVALWTTLVPWTLIFGILFLLILVFPSWLSPFSNTIGYAMCYITGISSFFKGILHDRIPKQDDKNNKCHCCLWCDYNEYNSLLLLLQCTRCIDYIMYFCSK